MKNRLRVMAMARPGAVPLPADRHGCALTSPQVFERWASDQAGIRPAALEVGDNVITMFDVIGEDYWTGGGVTAKKVAAQLRAIGDRPVEVQINSPGGNMFEGLAIYNILREHPKPVTVKVMGYAASAASVIAMAGDAVEIGAASFLMIHNCWIVSIGNRHDMAEASKWLEPFDTAMADVYAQRSGMAAAEVVAMMDAETWISGSQAVEQGFADALLPADQIREDPDAKAAGQAASRLRALEHALLASGQATSRADARSRVNEFIQGKPDAALPGEPDAAADDAELATMLAKSLNILKG